MWQVGVQLTDLGVQVNATIFMGILLFLCQGRVLQDASHVNSDTATSSHRIPEVVSHSQGPQWYQGDGDGWRQRGASALGCHLSAGHVSGLPQAANHTDHPEASCIQGLPGPLLSLLLHYRIMALVPCWGRGRNIGLEGTPSAIFLPELLYPWLGLPCFWKTKVSEVLSPSLLPTLRDPTLFLDLPSFYSNSPPTPTNAGNCLYSFFF